MARRILVTGGAGMIGLEVCRQLMARGHLVHLFDLGEQVLRVQSAIPADAKVFFGSIADPASLRAAMRDCDAIIHLAALLGVQRSESDKLQCIEINIDGTKNVLECAVQHRIRKIVFASSSEVYGEPVANPVTEETPTQGKSVYAVTKLAGEELCKAYSQRYALKHVILRIFNCYGPYQAAQFVIPKFIRNVMHGRAPVVYGDGRQLRCYTYVSDTADATIRAALSGKVDGQVINIGSGEKPTSLVELARLIIRIGGKEGALKPKVMKGFDASDRCRSREVWERYCNPVKALDLMGWKASVPLNEGIRRVFDCGVIFDRWANLYDEDP
ncbi:MAG: hypothetical protein A3K19_28290 [Lentisphaerae bacterium RIFOXYB12_FULL_65_16]|nr:MAG: hypothetical protein A3K18_19540 [Lentisphaerae bacterium RIFOXYA12_64_32]OGV85490.1 MAG: hypothetical protein A3K19_28290 [Lentisphaerae bacterium RIFOXYB12_FULL_65_16]